MSSRQRLWVDRWRLCFVRCILRTMRKSKQIRTAQLRLAHSIYPAVGKDVSSIMQMILSAWQGTSFVALHPNPVQRISTGQGSWSVVVS